MESSGSDKPSATDATESAPGLDGEETLSERGSVGAGRRPATPNGSGKEAPSSSSSAGSKRKRGSFGSGRVEGNGPEVARSSSGDSTWSMNNLDDHHPFSSLRKNNGHSEHSVSSGGVALIRQPRGVLRLRKLSQNVNESGIGDHRGRVLRSNGISKATHLLRRNKRRKSRSLKENRICGDESVSCLKTENGTCDQDSDTKFCSENDLSVEKHSRFPGEPSNAVNVDKQSSGHAQEDDDVSLEENAARMLCSLSDNRCPGPLRKKMKSHGISPKTSFLQHSNHAKDRDRKVNNTGGPSRLLRKRDDKSTFRKRRPRRHFYEVSPHDVDPFCIVKERIRVFWPLDESWYFGLVKEYDPVRRMHHVRYDDKDEEWINLQNERIKLLFLPGEARKRSNRNNSRSVFNPEFEGSEREDMDGNSAGCSESEPIISWLVQSNQAKSATSSNINELDHISYTAPVTFDPKKCLLSNPVDVNQKLSPNNAVSGSSPANGDTGVLKNRRFRFVYSRRRFFRRKNGFLKISDQASNHNTRASSAMVLSSVGYTSSAETGAFMTYTILVPLKSVYKFIYEACTAWVTNSLFLLQHGTLIALWPTVHLDILLVDNALGLKHLFLDTCLRSAVSLFGLLVGSFNQHSRRSTLKIPKMPCTSVRFQISGLHGTRQAVFMLFSFVGIGNSEWKKLHRKLQYHYFKTELSKVNCSYANIKQLTSGTDERVSTSLKLVSEGLSFTAQGSQFFSKSDCSDVDPVICCPDERFGFSQNNLDAAMAPLLLLCHHLKLLIESNLISSGIQEIMPFSWEEDQHHMSQHTSDLVYPVPAAASGLCPLDISSFTDASLGISTVGRINHSSTASMELNAAEISLACNDRNIGDANVTCRRVPDQNGPYVTSDNLDVIHSPQKSEERCSPISIPQHKTSDPLDDKLLNKDENATQPVSNLIQELNDYPIGCATPTAPRTTYHRNRFTSISRTFGDGSKLWPEDLMLTGFVGGSKKPRTQVSYSVSAGNDELGLKHKGHFRKMQLHSNTKTNDTKRIPDNSASGQSSPESLTCVANVLVTVGDRGWREYDTQITMDSDGQSDRRICVKLAEGTKYAHKVCQVLQPGATNRYTHAMMWKGGPEWYLEFPDRSQWLIFKQMHDECYSHNIRAASVKNIPIPGVCLVESHDDTSAVSFVLSEDYLRHIGTDVEIALDESRVIYDMDSDDEEWISEQRKSLLGKDSTACELADDLFERVMDKFEKLACVHKCNELTIDQMKEVDIDNVPLDTIKVIHDHWQVRRQKKGMPLIRHFQPAMWKIYEQQLQEWESMVHGIQGSSNGYHVNRLPPKPALFAFCLKPRGLQSHIPYKGPKQRSHKKLMYSGCHSFSREQDGFYRPGRKYNEYVGDGRTCESYDGGYLPSPAGYSPRFSVRTHSPRAFDVSERGSTPRFFRSNSVKRNASFAFSEDHQQSPSFRHQKTKRSTSDHWGSVIHDWQISKHMFPGSSQSHHVDIEELKLRDASSAAQHAAMMAKLKRERAHCLMHKADLAVHKATVALIIADAIRASKRGIHPGTAEEI